MTDLNSAQTPMATSAQGWQLTTLAATTAEEKMEVDMEIERLEEILGSEVQSWQDRLDQVNAELGGRKV